MGRYIEARRAPGENETERVFAAAVARAGFAISRSPSIRSPYPVDDKNGTPKKRVTTPDYLVTDQEASRQMYVEVTHGNGELPSKEAQLRVIRAAGITNYMLVTGDQVKALEAAGSPDMTRSLILRLFHWDREA